MANPPPVDRPAAQGAFTARSVVASMLLGTPDGQMPGGALARAATVFGIPEGTTRVALARMVGAGELTTERGAYRLAGPLIERQRRQEQGRRPRLRTWDGTWCVAVVGGSGLGRPASERATVRRRLDTLRCAEWREGVWVRPDNLEAPRPAVTGGSWLAGARFDDPADATRAAGLWDLEGWQSTARHLLTAMATTPPEADIAAGFALAAAVVRHLRDDPLLPDALLPGDWRGPELRAAYDGYERRFQTALRAVLHHLGA